ncbi:hypothetical protein ENUP19_0095G0013 [Entamoeba nuttalli]|uniref:Uncharacterized protein n=2 Tax=Entamoeba nuttalli TaxID=412467 RepID=K2H8P1_ENTNP|nr:hypothetical protein ENU1_148270 [Entamoeba nuttalli P19]EKE38909.1 hypothetical protein ENU1_148270 [Entamoeba nuttalli P19]|eukprot:XP_008858758.1 hypothetical protein ENU1_148270 [Entamoeba nuttalli P19]
MSSTVFEIIHSTTCLSTTKCKMISSLKNTLNQLEYTQLYHYYLNQENEMVHNELLHFFINNFNTNCLILIKQETDLKIESDKCVLLLLQIVLKEPSLVLCQSSLFSINDLFQVCSRHLLTKSLVDLIIQFITLLQSNKFLLNKVSIDELSFHSMIKSLYLLLLDSLDYSVFILFNQYLLLSPVELIASLFNHYNIDHLIQSTLLSKISDQCIQFLRILVTTLSNDFLEKYFSRSPLCDYLIESFFENPNNEVLITLLTYTQLSSSIAFQILKSLPPFYHCILLLPHLIHYIPKSAVIEYFQQVIFHLDGQTLDNKFIEILLSFNEESLLDISSIIPQIIKYIEDNDLEQIEQILKLIHLITLPQYYLSFLISGGLHVLLDYGCVDQLYSLLKCSLFDFIPTFLLNKNDIPSSFQQLQLSIDTTPSLAILWLSLLSEPLFSIDFISTIQPQDSIGSELLLSIQLHLKSNCTQQFPSILFGDTPFTGTLSYPFLDVLLSEENEFLIQQNKELIIVSIQGILDDPSFTFLSFKEKQEFEIKVEWVNFILSK